MSETLLDKAVHNYNVAIMIYNFMEGDESYPKTHDIDQLIRIARQNNVNLHLSEYIDDHSEMFTLWESRTRYVLNYQLELNKVEKAMKAVGEYLKI